MKHLNKILCGLLFSFTLLAGSVPAMADEAVISTKADADGKTVTVEVTAEAGTEITSGRVVVSYDEDLLTLKTVETADTWEAEDVNTDTEESVSYAFADAKGSSKGGDIMTLTFLAKDAANGKKATIQTEVKELYNADTALEQSGKTEKVSVIPSWKDENKNDDKDNDDKNDGNGDDKKNDDTGTTETVDNSVIPMDLAEVLAGQISSAADGATISVNISASEEVIPASVLEALKGKNVTLEFHLENGVIWRVNGTKITEAKEIDLGVTLNTANIPEAVLKTITDDGISYEMQFSLDFEGDLGGTFELSIPVGSKGAGLYGNLYYYNPAKGALEYMQTDTVAESGMVTYSFTHASDYVIAVSTTNGAEVNTVKTGDDTSVAGYILLLCGAAVVFAAAVKRRKIAR